MGDQRERKEREGRERERDRAADGGLYKKNTNPKPLTESTRGLITTRFTSSRMESLKF